MPVYLFKNPKNGKIVEIFQGMKDEHVFVDDSGLKWERVFSVPFSSIDTQINPDSVSEFRDKTANKGMTIGQMWDESRALSDKREKTLGKDPVKEKYYENYSKKRKGKKHPDQNKT